MGAIDEKMAQLESKNAQLRNTLTKRAGEIADQTRAVVRKAECAAGAGMAGFADARYGLTSQAMIGARPSTLGGVALVVAGMLTDMEDIAAIGEGALYWTAGRAGFEYGGGTLTSKN